MTFSSPSFAKMRFGKDDSTPPSFVKNRGMLTCLEIGTIVITLASRHLQFDLSNALIGWFLIQLALRSRESIHWLCIPKISNELVRRVLGFIRLRGRPNPKPPDKVKAVQKRFIWLFFLSILFSIHFKFKPFDNIFNGSKQFEFVSSAKESSAHEASR